MFPGWLIACAAFSIHAQVGPADDPTVALWLFDETHYPNVTLTAAGPLRADLRLLTGVGKPLPRRVRDGQAGLVPGRFGNALALPLGENTGVVWAGPAVRIDGAESGPDREGEVP